MNTPSLNEIHELIHSYQGLKETHEAYLALSNLIASAPKEIDLNGVSILMDCLNQRLKNNIAMLCAYCSEEDSNNKKESV